VNVNDLYIERPLMIAFHCT